MLVCTVGIGLAFDDGAIETIAAGANTSLENLGTPRLHTMLERVLDGLSSYASKIGTATIPIMRSYERVRMGDLLENEDVSRRILQGARLGGGLTGRGWGIPRHCIRRAWSRRPYRQLRR